ncbi:hypothetical protein D3C87_1661210 [compost metagenome]
MSTRRLYALGRLKAGERNKTEARYEQDLELRKRAGEILWYGFEVMTFKLADGCRLTPDFMVLTAAFELEAHDCKGSRAVFSEDARVKMKVAAEHFPVRFIAVYPRKVKDGGGWDIEDFSRA